MNPATPAPVPTLVESLRYFVRLLFLMRGYWGPIAKGILIGFGASLFGMGMPLITTLFIDDVYPARDFGLLHVLVLGTLGFSIGMSLVGAVRSYYTQVIGGQLSNAASLMFFNHVQHQPIRFFDERRVGEVLSRFGDVRNSLGTISRTIETLLVSGTYFLLVPPVLFFLNWRLALLSIVTLPVTTAISVGVGRVTRKLWKQSAEARAELSALQVDALSQIRTLKLAGAERAVYERAAAQTHEALRLQLRAGGVGISVGVLNGAIKAVGTACYTWYAWTLVLRGELTLGQFMAFSAYVAYMVGPVTQMASLFAGFQQSAVALGRMFEYLDAPPESDPAIAYTPREATTVRLRGPIELRDVGFGYAPARPVLHDVSLTCRDGAITAVVGPSGAGKSSLLRLLCRIDRPDVGYIAIGGHAVQELALQDLRRQMSVVWQEVGLLRGTIRENLTIGAEGASSAAIDRALGVCRLTDTVAALPKGLDTMIAEWGASLSGGQRQRVALARALIRDTPIIVLDEATSNLDVQMEHDLLRDFFSATAGKTVVFVTHRVVTAAMANHICVLESGRVVAAGTHEDVLRTSETYRTMLRTASGTVADAPQLRVLAPAVLAGARR